MRLTSLTISLAFSARRAATIALRRAKRDERGIAAVEFALILPLMLMIYMGLVELSRGMRVAAKLDLVAHTLADLTAQQLTGGANTGQAGLTEADMTEIFTAANTLMAPFPVASLKMTITEVNITLNAGNYEAHTAWSITHNGATRSCGPLTPSNNPPVSPTTISTNYLVPSGGVNPPLGPLIVTDVIYTYSPGVSFELFKWKTPPTWTMKRTNYAAVRNTYVPSHIQYYMTSGLNCNAPAH